MSENTKIEWADHTFNPWIGCTKVGPGCDNCYAKADFDDRKHRVTWGAGQERSRTKTWGGPVRWNKQHEAFFAANGRRQRVFCASLADVFDKSVDPTWRHDLWQLIQDTPHLDWLLLTKRIGNVFGMLPDGWAFGHGAWPNVWIGATIVNQEEADRDIPKLLAVPAAKRFLSMEPLLGPVTIDQRLIAPIEGTSQHGQRFIDWVIVGGESGPGARPMHPDWARSLRDQCEAAGVPFLFKQWGEWVNAYPRPSGTPGRFRLAPHDKDAWISTRDMDVYPRQFTAFGSTILERVGKKAAGRLLDGREWNGAPA